MEKASALPQDILIENYLYELPDERIARFPLPRRDQSKLLCYRARQIGHTRFDQLPGELPPGALLVFNDTRVIHARLRCPLPNSGDIEVFCLDPLAPVDHQMNLSSTSKVVWKCLIGNNRRWKSGHVSLPLPPPLSQYTLHIERISRIEDAFEMSFEWDAPHLSFGAVLNAMGTIPLPPYLKRETQASDAEHYQTVYAEHEGSVAAPTAGLHFTPEVFADLEQRGIDRHFVTLHVGAGTFNAIKYERLGEHPMHEERVHVGIGTIRALTEAKASGRAIVPVGTTGARVLESLYWYGLELLRQPPASGELFLWVSQWAPYEQQAETPAAECLHAIAMAMEVRGISTLTGATQILIAPPYRYRVVDGLITNFHQPQGTLLLLIAALVGDDWRRIYDYALQNEFRFLSYGDSSLLLP